MRSSSDLVANRRPITDMCAANHGRGAADGQVSRRMMPAMRIVAAFLALAALTCATQSKGPACIDLSGTYKLAEQPVRKGTGSAAFVFGEGASLARVETLTIAQPGCRIELQVK